MIVVLDELEQGHAVLDARTDQGDFILDNRRDTVLPWHRSGYLGNQVTATSASSQ
jgi:predicted transglutaminase-like cysteine proteinase